MSNKVARDLAIARIAGGQHGVISSKQLIQAGVSRSAASRRAQAGRLHRVHQGVYAVGHEALSMEGRWMAAVLACGADAVISHLSAAHLWGLLNVRQGPIDVSVPSSGGRARRLGIHIHRPVSLPSQSRTQRRGVPVTSLARTIADLRQIVTPALLRRAVRQAEVLGLRTDTAEKNERTRSELEHLFLRLCEQRGLPMPVVNVRVGPYEVDFLWHEQRLIVETDGYRYHRGAQAFEDDRERDLDLRSRGYTVHRFSYRQVTTNPQRVVTSVAAALRR